MNSTTNNTGSRAGPRTFPSLKVLIRASVSGVAVALLLFLSSGGGLWPPPPGVRERSWRETDTWQIRRRESPWAKPLEEDPIYQRYATVYDRMEELEQKARQSGWINTGEYRQLRFLLDRRYSGGRSVVYRTRSSGIENTPRGRELIGAAIEDLENILDEAFRKSKSFENGAVRETSLIWSPVSELS